MVDGTIPQYSDPNQNSLDFFIEISNSSKQIEYSFCYNLDHISTISIVKRWLYCTIFYSGLKWSLSKIPPIAIKRKVRTNRSISDNHLSTSNNKCLIQSRATPPAETLPNPVRPNSRIVSLFQTTPLKIGAIAQTRNRKQDVPARTHKTQALNGNIPTIGPTSNPAQGHFADYPLMYCTALQVVTKWLFNLTT